MDRHDTRSRESEEEYIRDIPLSYAMVKEYQGVGALDAFDLLQLQASSGDHDRIDAAHGREAASASSSRGDSPVIRATPGQSPPCMPRALQRTLELRKFGGGDASPSPPTFRGTSSPLRSLVSKGSPGCSPQGVRNHSWSRRSPRGSPPSSHSSTPETQRNGHGPSPLTQQQQQPAAEWTEVRSSAPRRTRRSRLSNEMIVTTEREIAGYQRGEAGATRRGLSALSALSSSPSPGSRRSAGNGGRADE